MCDFTLAPNKGFNFFFNGQCVILADKLSASNELYYSAPTGTRSKALAEYGYNELCLMLDSLYGLKEVHGIDSFAQLFEEIGFDEGLRGTDPDLADRLIYNLINMYFDDIHSGFRAYSYLTGPIDYDAEKGPSLTGLMEHRNEHMAARAEQYPDGAPRYEEIGRFGPLDSPQRHHDNRCRRPVLCPDLYRPIHDDARRADDCACEGES